LKCAQKPAEQAESVGLTNVFNAREFRSRAGLYCHCIVTVTPSTAALRCEFGAFYRFSSLITHRFGKPLQISHKGTVQLLVRTKILDHQVLFLTAVVLVFVI